MTISDRPIGPFFVRLAGVTFRPDLVERVEPADVAGGVFVLFSGGRDVLFLAADQWALLRLHLEETLGVSDLDGRASVRHAAPLRNFPPSLVLLGYELYRVADFRRARVHPSTGEAAAFFDGRTGPVELTPWEWVQLRCALAGVRRPPDPRDDPPPDNP